MAQSTRIIVLQRPDQPLEAVCARLQGWGCELASCASFDQAAAVLADGADIVLIDAWIEDGLPLLTQMKANAATRSVPIVIGTAEEPGASAVARCGCPSSVPTARARPGGPFRS
jgi:DNA-binding response OmpR family regulator